MPTSSVVAQLTPLAGATIAASGNGSAVPLGSPTAVTCNEAIAILNCTAVGTGGGQTILIAGSSDGGTTWVTLGTFGVSTIASGTVGVRTGISTLYLKGGIPPLLRYSNTRGASSSITATITVIGLVPTDSADATVMPGVGNYASALKFLQQPTTVVHGSHSITPAVTVNVVDYLGVVCAAESTSVTLTLGSTLGASGVLTGTNPASASSGVASFADLQISAAGNYFLVASAAGCVPVISNTISVT